MPNKGMIREIRSPNHCSNWVADSSKPTEKGAVLRRKISKGLVAVEAADDEEVLFANPNPKVKVAVQEQEGAEDINPQRGRYPTYRPWSPCTHYEGPPERGVGSSGC